MPTDTRTIETHGVDLILLPHINHYPGRHLRGRHSDDPVFARHEQRSRPHEDECYYTDAQNMTRVKNLLSVAKEHGQISQKHLREIIYRIDVTHPELPI